jgi:hypothetical protein
VRDPYERFVAASQPGLYESHYLKANDPTGDRALWIKHNLLRRPDGTGMGEFWAIRFRKGEPPVVVKREVPYSEVTADPTAIALDCGPISLRPDRARGAIADARWDLRLSGGNAPLFLLRHDWMYPNPVFPKKKGLTPAPNLRFDGEIAVGDEVWPVDGWVGLRGHNWGSEHAYAYAYGNCNLWDDGDPRRTVDGISARIRLGGRTTPWLSLVVGQGPDVAKNRLRGLLRHAEVEPGRWKVGWPGVSLEMWADPAEYAGLRYLHPDGKVSYCYNTKFARVAYTVGETTWTSSKGELEVLYAEPLPGVPVHPTPEWSQSDGDYRS